MNRTDLAQPDACLHGASSLRNADGAPACLLCRREEARALTVEDLAQLPGACRHGATARRTARPASLSARSAGVTRNGRGER